jgi:hypothetical protein
VSDKESKVPTRIDAVTATEVLGALARLTGTA